jgi:predicted RND superfamily exporter protein
MISVGRWAHRHGWWVVLASVIVSLPCLLLVSRLRIETNLLKVFPADDPLIQDFLYFSQNFGVSDALVILVRGDFDEMRPKIAELDRWLNESPYFSWASHDRLTGRTPVTVFTAFPVETSMDQPFCIEMTKALRRFLAEHQIEAEFSGAPVVVTEVTESITRDVFRTGAVALGVVLIILAFSFGDPLFPFVAVLPVAIAILWSLAFAQGVWGRVTFAAAALPTSLWGIGIDYALHIRASHLEFHGDKPHAIWQRVYGRVGRPLSIAMLTSAAAFLSLLFAQTGALKQTGIVGAVALLLIFALCLLQMPVLLEWRDRFGLRWWAPGTHWLGRLAHACLQHRALTVAAFAAVTAPLLVCAMKMRISPDPMAYVDLDLPSVRLRSELAEKLGMLPEPLLIATDTLQAEERVVAAVQHMVGAGRPFARAQCLSKLTFGRAIAPEMKKFRGKDGRLCMVLFPSFVPYENENPARMQALIREIRRRAGTDIACMSGPPIVFMKLLDMIAEDLVRVGVASGAMVMLVLVVLIRRPRYFLSAAVPLAGGIVWMLGAMYLAGQQITAANVVAMPLVLGLGIDYGVHIVHRLRSASVEEAVSTTGRAIVVASVTTVAAFATLCLAHTEALVGMGLAAASGIAACLLWSLMFLPALLGRAPGHLRTHEHTEDAGG